MIERGSHGQTGALLLSEAIEAGRAREARRLVDVLGGDVAEPVPTAGRAADQAKPAAPAKPVDPAVRPVSDTVQGGDGVDLVEPSRPTFIPGKAPAQSRPPVVPGLPVDKPQLPDDLTDEAITEFVWSVVDWVGPEDFFAMSLQEVATELETDEKIGLAASREWGDLTPQARQEAIERYAADPFMSLSDALAPEGFDADLRGANDSIDGDQGDDRILLQVPGLSPDPQSGALEWWLAGPLARAGEKPTMPDDVTDQAIQEFMQSTGAWIGDALPRLSLDQFVEAFEFQNVEVSDQDRRQFDNLSGAGRQEFVERLAADPMADLAGTLAGMRAEGGPVVTPEGVRELSYDDMARREGWTGPRAEVSPEVQAVFDRLSVKGREELMARMRRDTRFRIEAGIQELARESDDFFDMGDTTPAVVQARRDDVARNIAAAGGDEAFYAQELFDVSFAAEFSGKYDTAAEAAWRDLDPVQRAAAVDLMVEGVHIDRALEAVAQGGDTIDGGQGDDTLAAGPGVVRRVAGDVGTGIVEGATQAAGGVIDGVDAMLGGIHDLNDWVAADEFRSDVKNTLMGLNPGFKAGDVLGSWALDQLRDARDDGRHLPKVRDARSVTGGMVRGISQFLTGFVAGGKVMKAAGMAPRAGAGYQAGKAMLQAAFSDFVAFDGHEARLSDMVEMVPALQNPVTGYLASDIDDSEIEGRLKNVAEGVLTDVALSGLVAGLRAVKSARRLRDGTGAETYAEAQRRLSQDTALERGAPDMPEFRASDAPAFVDRNASTLRDRKVPSMLGREDPAAVAAEIQTYLDSLNLKPKGPEDDPLAEALATLRTKAGADAAQAGAAKGAHRRPVAQVVKGLGGVDPDGPLGRELMARGITPTTFPALFKRGGRQNLDNIPVSEQPIFGARGLDDGNGYVPEQGWIDALEDEMRGNPWRDTADEAAGLDMGELGALADDLDRMGIDYINLSDAEVRAAMDDAMREAKELEGLDRLDDSAPRTETDLEAELAERAAAGDLHVSEVPIGKDGVFVNWARIDTADDVRAVVQKMADKARGEIDTARRGVRTNADTAKAAAQEDAWDLLVSRRDGDALNAEKTLALRQLWTASAEKLAAAAKAMAKSPTPQSAYVFRRTMALHGAIQREVISVRTETARALQQWKMPAGSNGLIAGQVEEAVRLHGDVGVSRELAERIARLTDDGNLGAVDELSRKSALAATSDAVYEYWIMAILSGPKTHLVNAMSNTGVIIGNVVERATAAKIGQLRGTMDPVEAAEAGAMLQGLFGAIPDAVRYAGKAFGSGSSGYGIGKIETRGGRSISTEALGNTRNVSFNKAVNMPLISHGINAFGSVMSVPGRALMGADEFFKTINYRMEVHAAAARQSAQDVRAGRLTPDQQKARMVDYILDPAEETMERARDFAQYSTFTNDAGRVAAAFHKLRHHVPGVRYVVPFLNTPANILRFAAERSPAGALLGDVRADIRAGGARADMALAKMGLGSMALWMAFDAALNGRLTGSGPGHKGQKDALRRTGWMPNAIRVGDRFFSYSRMDPYGMLFGVAGNLAEMALSSDIDPGEDVDEVIYGSIGAIGQTMMDKAYVQGLSDLFTAMAEPERRAARYLENLAGSFVPAIVREAETFVDPVLRRNTDTLETIKSRIPGLSGDLAPVHDLWGKEKDMSSGLGKFYDALSPIYSSKLEPEPIDLELLRIGYAPGMPSSTITEEGERFVLKNRPEVYERYVVLQGNTPASDFAPVLKSNGEPNAASARMAEHGGGTLLETLNAIVTGDHPLSQEYEALDAIGRGKFVSKVISDYRYFAKNKLIEEFPEEFAPGTGRVGGDASPYSTFVEPDQ